jgi:hypothetical protein
VVAVGGVEPPTPRYEPWRQAWKLLILPQFIFWGQVRGANKTADKFMGANRGPDEFTTEGVLRNLEQRILGIPAPIPAIPSLSAVRIRASSRFDTRTPAVIDCGSIAAR